MIISKTPLRISFLGGGSDFREHFRKHGGAVLSATIDKYVHVTVSPSHDGRVHLHYSQIEVVECACQLKHDIVRAALEQAGIERGVEIHIIADLPGHGTGLGSSSALAVGLVNALDYYKHAPEGPSALNRGVAAQQACQIEIERLRRPIGEQDQYAAAMGGMALYRWGHSGWEDAIFAKEAEVSTLNDHILLFNTGLTRRADSILTMQRANVKDNTPDLIQMAYFARTGFDALMKCNWEEFGLTVGVLWTFKQSLARGITTPQIDLWMQDALAAGAWGGKICGAGGGGYLLLIAPPTQHDAIRAAVGLPELKVRIGVAGSEVKEL